MRDLKQQKDELSNTRKEHRVKLERLNKDLIGQCEIIRNSYDKNYKVLEKKFREEMNQIKHKEEEEKTIASKRKEEDIKSLEIIISKKEEMIKKIQEKMDLILADNRALNSKILSIYDQHKKEIKKLREINKQELNEIKNEQMRDRNLIHQQNERIITITKESEQKMMRSNTEIIRMKEEFYREKEKLSILKREKAKQLISNRRPQELLMKEIQDRITLLSRKTRIDLKLKEIEDEGFWFYDPSKYFSQHTKLEFHHNIARSDLKFISSFKPKQSNYDSLETFEELSKAFRRFENVVVDLANDKVLCKVVVNIRKKYRKPIMDLLYPKNKKNRQEEEEEEEGEGQKNLKHLMSEVMTEVSKFFNNQQFKTFKQKQESISSVIKSSTRKNGGNNVLLGDFFNKGGKCRHIATLFKIFCDAIGVRCKLEAVYGFHVWNLIQLKGEFYYVDVTYLGVGLFSADQFYDFLYKEAIMKKEQLEKKEHPEVRNIFRVLVKMIIKKEIEDVKLSKLKEYSSQPQNIRHEDFHPYPIGQGGSGDVILYSIQKNVMVRISNRISSLFGNNRPKNFLIFKKGEVVAIKRITIRKADSHHHNERGIPMKYALRESSQMKILDHPCIIDVLGHWVSNDKRFVFIAMNAMDKDGAAFKSELENKNSYKNMTKKYIEVMYLLVEVARGLRYLSTLDIVHLDLKLENILVTLRNSETEENKKEISEVRIIDFGGAKNDDVKTSNFLTTGDYDSPEIRELKAKKEIKVTVEKLEKVMNSFSRKGIPDLVAKIILEFGKIKSFRSTRTLEEVFKRFCTLVEENDEIKLRDPKWIEVTKKKFEGIRIYFSSTGDDDSSEFDCRADIYSFGKMMELLKKQNLLPQELESLMISCLCKDRRNRPKADDIIPVLQRLLSFFNQKLKEEEIGRVLF